MGNAFTPAEVMAMLHVSDATLRRMARAYERMYGELPTDVRQARVYTDDAVKRIEAARELVEQGRAASFDKALEVLSTNDLSPDELIAQVTAPAPVQQLLSELQGIRQALDRQNALLEEQAERISSLESENKAFRGQLHALPSPEDSDAKRVIADLEKRNQALRAALETKEREDQERQRPWWRVWARRSTA